MYDCDICLDIAVLQTELNENKITISSIKHTIKKSIKLLYQCAAYEQLQVERHLKKLNKSLLITLQNEDNIQYQIQSLQLLKHSCNNTISNQTIIAV